MPSPRPDASRLVTGTVQDFTAASQTAQAQAKAAVAALKGKAAGASAREILSTYDEGMAALSDAGARASVVRNAHPDAALRDAAEVSEQEMNRLIAQAASQYRGEDQKRFLQLVQENPMFAAQIRAPLYEDKVVDFLFSTADITDRKATREQLEADLESEEGHVHGPGCGHDHAAEKPVLSKAEGPKAKKGAAKKAKDDASEPIPTKAKPAAKKADIVEKSEKPKPAKPAKSEPANKAAAKAVASKPKAEAKPVAKPKKPARKG